MSNNENVVTTKTHDWKQRCREWVKAGESFELHGVESEHILFIQELCAVFKCNIIYLPRKGDIKIQPLQ